MIWSWMRRPKMTSANAPKNAAGTQTRRVPRVRSFAIRTRLRPVCPWGLPAVSLRDHRIDERFPPGFRLRRGRRGRGEILGGNLRRRGAGFIDSNVDGVAGRAQAELGGAALDAVERGEVGDIGFELADLAAELLLLGLVALRF